MNEYISQEIVKQQAWFQLFLEQSKEKNYPSSKDSDVSLTPMRYVGWGMIFTGQCSIPIQSDVPSTLMPYTASRWTIQA